MDNEIFSIFTESSENKGILYNSYKFLNDRVSKFLDVIEDGVKKIKKDPVNNNVDIREDITKFKDDVNITYSPSSINIREISKLKGLINKYRADTDAIFKRYSKLRYNMAFGGNYVHGILMKSKAYSKEINSEHYDKINKNIRNVDRALDWVEKVLIDLFNMIDQDLNILTIVGVYNKRKIYENGDDILDSSIYFNESYMDCNSPEELLRWMDKISYGWISNEDGKVHGIGENDDEHYFYDNYILQTPDELEKSLVGVCWDQTEFEREWFKEHGYGHKIYYLELNDGEGCPSHTFASYISKETGRLYWFEHSWGKYAGMHYYKSESELLRDVISKHREAWDDQSSPVILAELKDTPRYGMTCEEFMNFAHSQPGINVEDLMNVNRSDEIMENLVLSTHTCSECNHTFSNVEIRFDSPADYDRISQLHPDWDLSKGRIGYIICPKCNTRNDIIVDNPISESYSLINIPDKLYFASPTKLENSISVTKDRGLFLTPYVGIASLFVIDRQKVMRQYFRNAFNITDGVNISSNYTIGYDEWDLADDELYTPLEIAHIKHNIPNVNQFFKGTSSGYIHEVDVSTVKDFLQLYVTKDANRELVYKGPLALKITNVIPHSINWEIRYDKKYCEKVGWKGSVKISGASMKPTLETNYDTTSYICDKCGGNLNNINTTDVSKKDYEKAESEFPNWDGRYGKLGMIICPECGKHNYIITGNKRWDEGVNIMGDDLSWIDQYIKEEGEDPSAPPPLNDESQEEKKSMPKQTDARESDKNGVRRKKLYISFIEWAKACNSKNTFGSIFDKDIFNVTYPFVPNDMRYFYRLANPILCVLSGDLTFFQVSELRKLNAKNSKINEMLIFAATPNDMRVFNIKDKKIYRGVDENGSLILKDIIGDTFDLYIQGMIKQGDILNGPIEESYDMESI